MNNNDGIKSCLEREFARINDGSKLSLQSIARDSAFQPTSSSQSNPGAPFMVSEHPDGQRSAARPASSLMDRPEDVRALKRSRNGSNAGDGNGSRPG